MNVKKTAAAALALSAALMAAPALADGFAVYENSARGVGMSGAMMFSDEASLVACNPAGLWRLKDNGRGQISGAVTYIAPRGKADFYHDDGSFDHSEHNKNNPAYVPTLFWAKKLSDRWAIGVGAFARFGLRATYESGWYGRYSSRSAEYAAVSISPAVSYRLAKNLHLGLTGEIMYAQLKMDKSMYNPSFGGEVPLDLKGDNIGFGWGVGLDWQASDKLSLAFLYRSEVKLDLKGDLNLHTPLGVIGTSAHGIEHMPESYTFGVGWKFDDRTRMEFNAIKTMWNSYDQLTVIAKVPAAYQMMFGGLSEYALTEYKHWRNGWRYQFGIEHKLNDRWTIRAGFTYDTASANKADFNDYMVPTGTRRTYTIGASYRNKNVEYSLGYGWMYVSDKDINYASPTSPSGRQRSRTRGCDAHIISLGARIDL